MTTDAQVEHTVQPNDATMSDAPSVRDAGLADRTVDPDGAAGDAPANGNKDAALDRAADRGVDGTGGGGAGGNGDGGIPLPDAARDMSTTMPDAAASMDVAPDKGANVAFCDGYATKYCQRVAACSAFLMTSAFGTVSVCQTRVALSCRTEAALPGSGLSPTVGTACAEATSTATCEDFLGQSVPACQVKGSLAKDAPCGSGGQCQSGYCRTTEDSSCGKCDVRAAQGAACDSTEACEFPLLCNETGLCAKAAAEGGACNENTPCGFLHACGANNTCVPMKKAGEACNPDVFGECENGVCIAGADPSVGTCKVPTLANTGETCDEGADVPVWCAGSGSCVESKCKAPAGDGESCPTDPVFGSSAGCLAPASCVAGVCKLPASCQ